VKALNLDFLGYLLTLKVGTGAGTGFAAEAQASQKSLSRIFRHWKRRKHGT